MNEKTQPKIKQLHSKDNHNANPNSNRSHTKSDKRNNFFGEGENTRTNSIQPKVKTSVVVKKNSKKTKTKATKYSENSSIPSMKNLEALAQIHSNSGRGDRDR
jgi:hypothetical protein